MNKLLFSLFLIQSQFVYAQTISCKAGPSAKCGMHTQMVDCDGTTGYVDSSIKPVGGKIKLRLGVDKIYGPCGASDLQEELEICKWVGRTPSGEIAVVANQVQGPVVITVERNKDACSLPSGATYQKFDGPPQVCAGTVRCLGAQPKHVSCPTTGDFSCPSSGDCLGHDTSKPYSGDWESLGLLSAPIVIGAKSAVPICFGEIKLDSGKNAQASSGMFNSKCPTGKDMNDDSCVHNRRATSQAGYGSKSGGSGGSSSDVVK